MLFSELSERLFRYSSYGARVASNFELWPGGELNPATEALDDLVIRVSPAVLSDRLETKVETDHAEFGWEGLAQVRCAHGDRIDGRASPDADAGELAAALSGPALAAALGQRGLLTLHGTCVAFGRNALCLLGESGVGKSTLAATLCAHGASLVSDTMTVIDVSSSRPTVRVGPAQFKLWPDAAGELGFTREMHVQTVANSEKRVWRYRGPQAPPQANLDRIFLLRASGPVGTEAVAPAAAAAALLQNHFLAGYFDMGQRMHWLPVCARLAERAQVRVLRRGDSLAELGAVVAAIRADSDF